jgi:hypothetical protein
VDNPTLRLVIPHPPQCQSPAPRSGAGLMGGKDNFAADRAAPAHPLTYTALAVKP